MGYSDVIGLRMLEGHCRNLKFGVLSTVLIAPLPCSNRTITEKHSERTTKCNTTLVQLMPGILSSIAYLNSTEPSIRVEPAAIGMFGTVHNCIPAASKQRLSIEHLLRMTFLNATDSR